MKRLLLISLWIQIRALEATADGQSVTLHLVAETDTRHRLQMRHVELLAEITRLKSEYRRIKRGNGIRAACLEVV
jgi:hypothetical protein